MPRTILCATLFAVLLLGMVGTADAEIFTVKLKNGNWFQSRYQPQTAGWDTSKIMVLTEVGNWIALPADEIADITSETENRGFGVVLDTTTIVLGWAPNDAVDQDEEIDPQTELLRLLEARTRPQPSYSVEQFAEPSQTGGIPIWMTGVTTPPLGGTSAGPAPMSGVEPN